MLNPGGGGGFNPGSGGSGYNPGKYQTRYHMMDDDTTLQELVEDLASTLGLQSTQPSKMKTSRLLARKLKMLLKRN